ncbi:hypothetical protein MITS9504_00053 [Synechococcus sp. MIT S9504]|nr:hypothetical protein MITS9504_00053 [Synechococcus sp. MIT S9504]
MDIDRFDSLYKLRISTEINWHHGIDTALLCTWKLTKQLSLILQTLIIY